jgi:riboflavin synthase
MFTGIIQELGKIQKVESKKGNKTFVVKASKILKKKKKGQSIAVNGACVTIVKLTKNSFTFEAIAETLEKTNLGVLKKSDEVNLEPALKIGQELDGHLVQGHIDTKGTVLSFKEENKHIILRIEFPMEMSRFMAFKGSITINGVSLTISHLQDKSFGVDLIPHTLKNTNLGKLTKGDKVNLEVDMISKYIERMLNHKESQTKYEYLKDRNFI